MFIIFLVPMFFFTEIWVVINSLVNFQHNFQTQEHYKYLISQVINFKGPYNQMHLKTSPNFLHCKNPILKYCTILHLYFQLSHKWKYSTMHLLCMWEVYMEWEIDWLLNLIDVMILFYKDISDNNFIGPLLNLSSLRILNSLWVLSHILMF